MFFLRELQYLKKIACARSPPYTKMFRLKQVIPAVQDASVEDINSFSSLKHESFSEGGQQLIKTTKKKLLGVHKSQVTAVVFMRSLALTWVSKGKVIAETDPRL